MSNGVDNVDYFAVLNFGVKAFSVFEKNVFPVKRLDFAFAYEFLERRYVFQRKAVAQKLGYVGVVCV